MTKHWDLWQIWSRHKDGIHKPQDDNNYILICHDLPDQAWASGNCMIPVPCYAQQIVVLAIEAHKVYNSHQQIKELISIHLWISLDYTEWHHILTATSCSEALTVDGFQCTYHNIGHPSNQYHRQQPSSQAAKST